VIFVIIILSGDNMIDIIIPVYNTPLNDLERCLDSILTQSFDNYKVYIIDDGSNEETKLFLDNYVNDKDNFIVNHIINGGVSNARNTGIEISNSKYIAFVDSDDKVEKDFLKEAFDLIEDNNLDLIIGGYHEIKDDEIIRTRLSLPGLHVYEGESINNFLEKLLSGKTNDNNKEIKDCPVGRIYNRLFKRDSINSLRFNTNVHMSEDTLFMIDYTQVVKRIGIVDKVWYNYYINDYSISNSKDKDKMISRINGFIDEIKVRMNKEEREQIKNAYQARVDKANNFINEIKDIK
jgi:glycosyltransferase involved in cell wall biosynthesis